VLEEAGSDGRLTPPEQERMGRLRRAEDRHDFLAAHLLVRICAGRLLGVGAGEVTIVQRCATCGGPHGRPAVEGYPEVGVSLAHSRGVVAAAAGTVPVGVDVEAFPPTDRLAVGDVSVAFSAAETAAIEASADPSSALLLAWVRKEAFLKAGLVDIDGLAGFDLSALPLDPPPDDRAARSSEQGGWVVHDWRDRRSGAIGAVVAPAGAGLTLAHD
jgi:4'-phosphopantetheinyl transferase